MLRGEKIQYSWANIVVEQVINSKFVNSLSIKVNITNY